MRTKVKFNEGDQVVLKTGGPLMCVINTTDDDSCWVQWFEKSEIKVTLVRTASLRKAHWLERLLK